MPTSNPLLLSPAPSQCSLEMMTHHYGDVYEHSPWVAESAWQQGLTEVHDTPDALAELMGLMLQQASSEQQIKVIQAHPDLAGKAALAGELTQDSTSEQAGAGLDQCSPEEFSRFEALNAAYKKKFGFPFVIAVKGLDRHAILAAFEERLNNDAVTERQTAIQQIIRIARFRLRARAEQ
ncbi:MULTISPECIES: 2-oxo-4-hydroxy-4-carboxy-5-ureidoimidazoline decarboxylase [Halomonadaceae]|uniref:2-oxo-4-hydroxy-4-carboxy-5-ureidoimidazoline decarboxylase n=1 Tax=Vreelandella titanicae TaxID=664683 RepID=A0A558J904_9GAMM|nr:MULTISPECIES: 2-oxo-4-hydroxy-4-carboxy-5-ureidoimidazoline decarboxylase [Halomonas]MBR9905002.1 2-oxo-4-hydroxy-4-carboxy-5-ureidoimidazoline decarboxylase [Gammaproteobacteria bacterium]TVU90111.1 2-oxo-4-hydroxy-4-carboxy-5-ureidoimidazoline decarboxylase [Halomonas titanicae]CEP34808.1 2-oxo-4-hydroxy-4-carboxy-5-ureidoimidazoline decarboxylase [Halomonas sp. R57-5]